MYDAAHLLRSIDDHRWPILALFGAAMVLQTVAMVTAVRVSAREQVITVPLVCTFLWFAHDLGVVVRFHTWFVTYDHWFLKCFWAGLLSALLLEVVFLAQGVAYGRREFLPQAGRGAFAALVAGGAVAAVVGWEYLQSFLADPLYQAMPALTLWALPLAGTAQMLRRRSMIGQTVLMWGSFTVMVPFWWTVTAVYYGQGFRSWQYLTLGALTFAMYAAVTLVVRTTGRSPAVRVRVQAGLESVCPAPRSGASCDAGCQPPPV